MSRGPARVSGIIYTGAGGRGGVNFILKNGAGTGGSRVPKIQHILYDFRDCPARLGWVDLRHCTYSKYEIFFFILSLQRNFLFKKEKKNN